MDYPYKIVHFVFTLWRHDTGVAVVAVGSCDVITVVVVGSYDVMTLELLLCWNSDEERH